jgi:hypothetical protein
MQRALLLSFVANVALQPCLIDAVVSISPKEGAIHGTTATILIQGASMLETGQVSEVKPPEGVKTVVHIKAKNGGYRKGSPLYKKQERIDAKKGKKKQMPRCIGAGCIDAAKETDLDKFYINGVAVALLPKRPDIFTSLTSVSVYAVFVLLAAFLHKRHMVSGPLGARAKVDNDGLALPTWTKCGFAFSLCDCGNFMAQDLPICLTALCCPIVQWASTASRSPSPFLTYWKAVAILLAMVVLIPFTYGLSGLVTAFLFVRRRRSLRKSYNHSHPETRSMLEDVGLVLCCPSFLCCQLVQEAREVEHSYQTRPMQSARASADIKAGIAEDPAHLKAMNSVKDFHGKASTHAMRSTTISYFHEEGQAPDSTEAQDAHKAFLSTSGGPLFCGAVAFGIVGYFAINYSRAVGPGTCPYPLATFLYYYGYLFIGMALIMLCTLVVPPCYACNVPLHAGVQCVGFVLAVMTLLSYSQAHQCGAVLWWASLAFSSPLIACCVFLCCTPFGAAKATAFVGYKAAVAAVTHAPSYKAVATVATHGSAV